LGIEAKGRSGREVGKCGFVVKVGGREDLEAPMARGEETEGREYIMTGIWGEQIRTVVRRENNGTYMQGGGGKRVKKRRPAPLGYINQLVVGMDGPQRSCQQHEPGFCWGPWKVT